jgi:uncharacterized protein YodC (DUF2158 family)
MATSALFKVGDIVQLKSGGPKMTVTSLRSLDTGFSMHCQWFAGNKHQDAWFHEEALELANPDK